MSDDTTKPRKKTVAEKLLHRKNLKESFPVMGKVRAPQAAAYLGFAISTFWAFVADGRIDAPIKFGARVSVWDAEYIRQLAANGIPVKPQVAA